MSMKENAELEELPLLSPKKAMAALPPPRPPPLRQQEGQAFGSFLTQLRTFTKIAIPFFYQDRTALCMLFGLICLTILSNGISVLFSYVKSWVFDALNNRDEAAFWLNIEYFFAILVIAVPITVMYTFLRLNLALRWRQGFTRRVMDLYYQHRTYYILEMSRDVGKDQLDNPDQRIADDINQFTSSSLQFFFILFDAIVNLVSFSIVLFQIMPSLFVAILIYAGLGTLITSYMGRPLLSLYYEQMKKEANFRFGLIRTRENAEAIAFYDENCEQERVTIWELFEQACSVQYNIIRVQRNLEIFTTSFDYLAFVVPYIVVAPLYFAGKIELGSITQASEAFWNVRSDFSIIVNYFEDLSLFAAGLQRLHNYVRRIEQGGWSAAGTGSGSGAGAGAELHQLAAPGTVFMPPTVSFDPAAIEAVETSKKRQQAQTLLDIIKMKQTKKFDGKKVGGGSTNKEKARKKNFLMLRKSSAVQGKLKRSLREQSKVLRGKIVGDKKMDKRQKQKRRCVRAHERSACAVPAHPLPCPLIRPGASSTAAGAALGLFLLLSAPRTTKDPSARE